MHGMSPLEVKYHQKDIERSFAACRTSTEGAEVRTSSGFVWVTALLKWLARPSVVVLKRPL